MIVNEQKTKISPFDDEHTGEVILVSASRAEQDSIQVITREFSNGSVQYLSS